MDTSNQSEAERPVITPQPAAAPPVKKSHQRLFVLLGFIGLIIILTAGFVFFGAKSTTPKLTSQITPTSVQVLAPTIAPSQQPTITAVAKSLKEYKNEKWQFSIQYNPTWITEPCENDNSFMFFLAQTDNDLGKCHSDFGGQMSIFVASGNSVDDHTLSPSSFTAITNDEITVDSVKGKRMTGTGTNADANPGYNKDYKVIEYVFFTNDKTYSFRYTKTPDDTQSQDITADFDTMIQNHLTFSTK
jgi:hypothetical protein